MAAIIDDAGTDGGHTHSYTMKRTTSTYLKSSATCTEAAKYYYSCSCFAKGTSTFSSGSANGHSYGGWSRSSDSYHVRTCSVCDDDDYESHGYGDWSNYTSLQHRRKCTKCSDYDYDDHNDDTKDDSPRSSGGKAKNDYTHNLYCSSCNRYMGTEAHEWPDSGHTCECGHTHSTYAYHYYGFANGDTISSLSHACLLDTCSHQIRLVFDEDVEGLPLDKYTASDAGVEMDKVPEFAPGTYYVRWDTSNTIYDKNYTKLKTVSIYEPHVRIYGWNQRTVLTHCYSAQAYLEEKEQQLLEQIDMWGNPRFGDGMDAQLELQRVQASLEELKEIIRQLELHVVTPEMVKITEEYFEKWPSEYRLSCRDTIFNQAEHDPTQTYESSNNRFKLKYTHGTGGWMFKYSPFFSDGSFEFTELFQYGNYTSDPNEKIYGNVFVYYRTTSGGIPRGNWSVKDYIEQKCIYDGEPITVSETKSINAGKTGDAWKNGYRVVGNAVQICGTGKGGPASSPTSSGSSASYTIKFDPDASCAHITFFVEEAKADVKYCYRTIENQKPYGTFKDMYTFGTLKAWTGGTMVQKATVTADMDGLIWPNAYRYVGYAVTKGDKGKVSPATYPPTEGTSLSVEIEEDFQDYDKTEIIVTFFLKPAELTVKYCYRTIDNQVPNSDGNYKYKEMYTDYTPNPVKAWTGGKKEQTVTINPDEDLIWHTGYRYVGYAVTRDAKGKTVPAVYPNGVKNSKPGTHTDNFDCDKTSSTGIDEAEIIITFFVDEAKTDIWYCYRATENIKNQTPQGGLFQDKYFIKTVESWESDGRLVQKITQPADLDLIWKSGYRYVGYAVTRAETGSVAPASWETAVNPATTAEITEDFDAPKGPSAGINRAGVIITFFVEPAELTVKYCYRTIENKIPNDSGTGYKYQEFYTTYRPNPVKSWTNGTLKQTVTIDPDMVLIYGTGYRYVGYSVTRAEKGKSVPAVYPSGVINSQPAVHEDDFDSSKSRHEGIDEAEITITFFVRNAEASILYCYRTPENLVPTNGAHKTYEDFYYDYTPNPVTSWYPNDNGGELKYEVKKAADLVKIDNTGYRYLGYKIARAENGTKVPAPYGEDLNPEVEAVWLEDFDSSKAPQYPNCLYQPEVIITFFIEPVIGHYGQLWRDEDGDISKDQVFRYKEGSEYQNHAGFKFPDYYNPTLDKCLINVSTFNKFFFPGEILIGAEVMDYKYIDAEKMLSDAALYNPWKPEYSKGNEIWLKTYTADTTTQWAPIYGDTSRLQLSEPFYSSYIPNHPQVSIGGIVNEERQGFAVDKQFWFVYNTPLTEILHVNYPDESQFMLDVNGQPIKGTIRILNEFAFLESLCTDTIGVPKTIGIGDSYFTYTAIGYNVKEIEIFEKTSSGLVSRAKITKANYPSYNGVFDKSFVEQYINIQSNINSDLLNANKNWRIVFKYEYKPELVQTKLTIKYKLNSVTGEDLQNPTEVLINSGDTYKVNVPTNIAGCVPEYYVKNSDPTQRTDFNNIIILGDPLSGNQTIIIVYVPSRPEEIVFNFGQNVIVRANISGDEEYDVEKAIPTSEDLYVSGDMYSYKFEENIEKKEETKTVRVKVVQRYYLDSENKTVGNTGSVSTDVFNVGLTYQYYDVLKAELYDLEEMLFENDGVKYYHDYNRNTGEYTDYEEGKATWAVDKKNPYIDYYEPTEEERVRINVNAADGMSFDGSVYTIVLPTIADVKPKKTDLDKQFNTTSPGVALEVLRRNTDIYLTKLILKEDGKPEVKILTGNSYRLNLITQAMAENINYIPFELERAPMYNFIKDQGLFVQEQVLNKEYKSKITGTYLLASEVLGNVAENHETSIATRGLAKVGLSINSIFVHTPIVNDITVKINQKLNQLMSGVTSLTNVVVLDEGLDITIKNSINFNSEKGYKNKEYNHNGLLANDEGAKKNAMLINKSNGSIVMNASDYTDETEEKTVGPAFAEYKLIKFPYDVYLVSGESNEGGTKRMEMPENGSILFKANEWYNLYEYIPVRTEKYHFVVPVWVEDAKEYTGENGIQILIVSENCDEAVLTAAKNNPMSVSDVKKNTDKNVYILRTTIDTYVAGRIYDLQIRDTDDPGFMGKVSPALTGNKTETHEELPLAQQGQVKAYNLGMKLGYRFYFDLKTKGIANKTINIKPKIYYVSTDGTVKDDISLFYHSKGSLYNKLTDNDLNIRMTMAGTHGLVNNAGYTVETVAAKQLMSSRVFTNVETIGKILNGLSLQRDKQKLPFDNILESAETYGFGTNKTTFVNSAKESVVINGENDIKNATGHWYGEYYLPASTIVVDGAGTTRDEVIKGLKKPLATGYLVVVFEEITTVEHDPEANYLTYDAPTEETQWIKEGIDTTIKLPNGKTATISDTKGAAMAIYQVGLRANNDYETEGTH